MYKRIVCVMGLMLLVGACSHRATLPVHGSPDEYRSANAALRHSKADVSLRSGVLLHCFDVRVAPDTTYGQLRDSVRRELLVSTPELAKIKVNRRSRGAFEGFSIGLVVGGVLGLLAGPADGDDCLACPQNRGETAVYGAIAGAVWGLVIGALRGARYEYSFAELCAGGEERESGGPADHGP